MKNRSAVKRSMVENHLLCVELYCADAIQYDGHWYLYSLGGTIDAILAWMLIYPACFRSNMMKKATLRMSWDNEDN